MFSLNLKLAISPTCCMLGKCSKQILCASTKRLFRTIIKVTFRILIKTHRFPLFLLYAMYNLWSLIIGE